MSTRILSVCLLSLSLLPGCATGKDYVINRSADLADIIRLNGRAGWGVAAKLEATRLLHLGGAYSHGVWAAGLHNRAIGTWRETSWSWGLLVGYHNEIETDGIEQLSGSYGWNFMSEGESDVFSSATGRWDLDLLTFRGTLMLGLGIDLEVRVGEVLDFVAGIFQFDPAGDDRDYSSMRKPDMPEPVEEPDGGEETGDDAT